MKSKTTLITAMLAGALALSMVSCAKKQGCTDSIATDFDATAKEDNKSCTYKGKIVFWYDKSVADTSASRGTTTLTYYVDNAIVGSSAASVYSLTKPDCGANGYITVEKDLGTNKSKTYPYKIVDENGVQIWTGTQQFDANTCASVQLVNQ